MAVARERFDDAVALLANATPNDAGVYIDCVVRIGHMKWLRGIRWLLAGQQFESADRRFRIGRDGVRGPLE